MILPASIYGRTKPQCDIGHTGEKNLQAMQLRVATSIELLKGVVQVSNRVLPRFRLYNHTLLLKTLADAIFQLELVGTGRRLHPPIAITEGARNVSRYSTCSRNTTHGCRASPTQSDHLTQWRNSTESLTARFSIRE